MMSVGPYLGRDRDLLVVRDGLLRSSVQLVQGEVPVLSREFRHFKFFLKTELRRKQIDPSSQTMFFSLLWRQIWFGV